MSLEDYRETMEKCVRCSWCKHVPYLALANVDRRFRTVCPSIERFDFHSWSGGGKVITSYSLLENRIGYSPKVVDIVYQCQMCGACDVSCKNQMDMEPYETLLELRARCVEDGQSPIDLMPVLDSLRKEDNTVQGLKKERGKWADGLDIKKLPEEKAEVLLFAGCRFSFDDELWPILRATATLLKEADVDIGIFGVDEACCGGRLYELGLQGEFVKYMENNIEAWRNAGVKTIVTPCADCYTAFKAWYSRFGQGGFEVLHSVEFVERLLKQGKIKLTGTVPLTVTYHDPCHLGRLSEPYLYSSPGKPYITPPKKVMGTMGIYDPPKPWRRGANGIYEEPRNILRSIPGLNFVEMYRIRDYAWCCGAGGGVKENYPDFAIWTAKQRISEAKAVGAEAIVTACGWCKRNFRDAIEDMQKQNGDVDIEVYDIIELVQKAANKEVK